MGFPPTIKLALVWNITGITPSLDAREVGTSCAKRRALLQTVGWALAKANCIPAIRGLQMVQTLENVVEKLFLNFHHLPILSLPLLPFGR
jgi:hypothetical protein